jgi:hypothetical protein
VTSAKLTPPKDLAKEILTLADDTSLMTDIDNFNSLPYGGLMYPDEEEPTMTLVNMVDEQFDPPTGALILLDPYKTYLKSVPSGQAPD